MDFLDNQLTPSTGTIRMRALLDNSQRLFTPGLFARVRLPGSAEFKATLIDDKAVLTDQDRKYVYIVDKDGKAQRRDITPRAAGRRFTHRSEGVESSGIASSSTAYKKCLCRVCRLTPKPLP